MTLLVDFTALSDATAAVTSDLVARRRATTLVPDPHATYRAQLVTAYATAAYPAVRRSLLDEAAAYDRRHPDEPSLADELYGADADSAAERAFARCSQRWDAARNSRTHRTYWQDAAEAKSLKGRTRRLARTVRKAVA